MQHFETSEFSWQTRQKSIAQAPHISYDLAIVGGGITGCAIALEASLRGLKTILIEQGDLGSGTSSKSTKLVHGGLRYLENLEFQLVFEARRERGRLLKTARHLVKEEPVIFPLYKNNWPYKKWQLKLGLSIYDVMALGSPNSPHKMLSSDLTLQKEPLLRAEGLQGSGLFYDCATNDARLTLYTGRTAAYWGAAIISYAQVQGFKRSPVSSAVSGLICRDLLRQEEFIVNADTVVVSVGPWANEFFRKLQTPKKLLRPSSGIHILIPKQKLPVTHTVAVLSPRDNRLLFVRPFNKDFTFIGTTDIPVSSSPEAWFGSTDEVSYLLDVLKYNFPRAGIGAHDLVGIWAGLRPLSISQAESTYKSSRDHHIEEIEKNVIVVTGGKLTTHHSMAKDCIKFYQKILSENHPDKKLHLKPSSEPYLIGSDSEWFPEVSIDTNLLNHLKAKYGSESQKIISYLQRKPELSSHLVEGTDEVLAEVLYGIKYEMIVTMADFFMRRSFLGFYYDRLTDPILHFVAEFMGHYLGWRETRIADEISGFKNYLNQSQQPLFSFRKSHNVPDFKHSHESNTLPPSQQTSLSTKAGA